MWMKSNCGERDSASAMARCGASKIEISWTAPTPMPVAFLKSAITGCIGTRYGDQIIPVTSATPAAFAAAMVRSSIDAARASGVVPGRKFATVKHDAAFHECSSRNIELGHDCLPLRFLLFLKDAHSDEHRAAAGYGGTQYCLDDEN